MSTRRVSAGTFRSMIGAKGRSARAGSAQRTVFAGRTYASKAEARYAERLTYHQRAGLILGWQPQVRYPLSAGAGHVRIGHYVADFEVRVLDGSTEVHEVKAWPTDLWAWKKRHLAAEYPTIKIVVVNARTLEVMSDDDEREMYYATRARAKAKGRR